MRYVTEYIPTANQNIGLELNMEEKEGRQLRFDMIYQNSKNINMTME